ncbi:MAG: hypothetical protein PHW69_04225 [Elusimicrobiaceae bacterium]|nr:hypothetical protein [Elusimicrobiaceae bacterium]
MTYRVKCKSFILGGLLLAFGACGVFAAGDYDSRSGKPSMSRDMTQAVRLYRENRYNDAMDKFLDILVTGNPSEKAIANDYINRINQRFGSMDDGSAEQTSQDDESTMYPGVPSKNLPDGASGETKYYRPSASMPKNIESDRLVGNVTKERRVIMAQRIERKISEIRRMALLRLNKVQGVQVYMNGEQPEAVSLDPDVVFTKDMNFRPEADNILDDLATVMYTLGKATFLILPEGIYAADTKIVDMRRAMAVNSYFSRKGISTARLSVNLNITSHELPAKFKNIPGLGILFYYDKPINTVITAQSDSDNPPLITLGVSEDSFDPVKNEGTIVEFAVEETGARISFWKFQLLYYDEKRRLHVVQDATGEESAYHQVFWNGREDFFGEPYPPGKYIAVVAAADIVGRERIVRRPVTILGGPVATPAVALQKALSGGGTGGGGRRAARSLDREKPQRRKIGATASAEPEAAVNEEPSETETAAESDSSGNATADGAEPASAAKTAASGEDGDIGNEDMPDTDEAEGEDDSQVKYTIAFRPGSSELSSNGGATVRQVSESMTAYPMSQIILTGTAGDKEPDAQNMAHARAQKVAEMLTSKYGVDLGKVTIKTRVSAESRAIVEVRMVTGK